MANPEENSPLLRLSSSSGRRVLVARPSAAPEGGFELAYDAADHLVPGRDAVPALKVRILGVELSPGVARAIHHLGQTWVSRFPQQDALHLRVGLQARGLDVVIEPPGVTGKMDCALRFSDGSATIELKLTTDLSCVSEFVEGFGRIA